MYLSDETVVNYLAGFTLLAFPIFGVAWGTWGIIWGVLLLIAVFLFGRKKGPLLTMILMMVGYGIALAFYGISSVGQMSFIPFAGLLGVLGEKRNWPIRVTFFWGAILAALLGALPTLPFISVGLDTQTANNVVNMTIQQYQSSGILTAMQQQGITELQVKNLLQQGIHFYVLIIPSLAAIGASLEFGLVFYGVKLWLKDKDGWIPFTRWRLPWYAVWGAVLGISFYLLGDQFSWTILRGIGINLMIFYAALTMVLGISLYLYMLQSPKIPRFIKWILIIVSFFYFFFSIVSIIMFGLFDIVFNFRRLPEEK